MVAGEPKVVADLCVVHADKVAGVRGDEGPDGLVCYSVGSGGDNEIELVKFDLFSRVVCLVSRPDGAFDVCVCCGHTRTVARPHLSPQVLTDIFRINGALGVTEPFELEKIVATDYTEEQVDSALLALALNGGSITQAVKDLGGGGMKLPPSTLNRWRDSYPNRYRFHLTENASKTEGRAVSGYLEIQHLAQQVAKEAIEKASDELRKGNVRDPASVARNMMVSAGVANTHMMNLQGRPSIITEHRRPENVIARLKELGLTFDAESTAVESPSESPALPSEASPSD